MALIGINPSRSQEPKRSRLETIALGLDIASKTLGMTLAVPEYLQKRDANKAEQRRADAAESRAAEKFPLEKQALQATIDERTSDNRPLTDIERKEIKDVYGLPEILLPRTVGEARSKQFMLSPLEQKKIEQTDKQIQLKEQELIESRKEKEQKKEEEKGKKKELAAAVVLKVNEGNAIPTTLVGISKAIKENKGLFGPVRGLVGEKNVYNVKTQTLDSELRAASQQFGRYMEGGVLRKEDEEKYRRMFPKLNDLPAVAEEKLNIVNDLLRRKQASDLSALEQQGYDIKGLSLPPEVKFVDGVPYERVEGGWREIE